MVQIVECVPNFSEGRRPEVVEEIANVAREVPGVTLLDTSSDKDHNRSVVTFIGTPQAVEEAAFKMVEKASLCIDMRHHNGEHPRMGACDVLPFIPIRNTTMEECVQMAKRVGERIGNTLQIPVYLYEQAASQKERTNLADIRKGQYEGFFEKIKGEAWKPDFGPSEMNAVSGCMAVGARVPLIAYNVNLNTRDITIADRIAKAVRHIGGGLRYVKAMGVSLEERNQVQVSMNLVHYEKTALYQAFEMVKMEAKRYGVSVVGSEVVGLLPAKALIDSAAYYLQLEDLSADQVLENRL
jgi:glutamate formiminotransferase / 5-formyltetrahydrofolate cyclo-ligase